MKPFLIALLLSFTAVSVTAQAVTFPTLSYPEPAPEPVTQEQGGMQE